MTAKCDTCGDEYESRDDLLVYALPGVPISVANCHRCFREDLYPVWVLIGNTAAIGGLEYAAAWWKDAVARTLPVVGVTEEEFDKQVEHAIVEYMEAGL